MHIGVIPDGNRRYARSQGIDKMEAYEEAKETIKQLTDSLEGVSEEVNSLSFYLLSEENLKRTDEELEALFHLLDEHIEGMAEFFHERDFKVNWASTRPEALPEVLQQKLENIEQKFDEGDTTVNLLISYSGKEDILHAGEKIAEEDSDFIEENFSNHLEISEDIDFVIRTGDNPDRECISGFPIWNSAYAEFYHIKKNFPAINAEDVQDAFDHYKDLRKKKGE
jgi:tritrans,polycis-undecaprenyl-diphosphate synthase [geranylgeranyl-diphosphate specific]